MDLKQAKKFNFKCAVVAMILTQIIIFNLEVSALLNSVLYILNLFFWIIVMAVIEGFLQCVYEEERKEVKAE